MNEQEAAILADDVLDYIHAIGLHSNRWGVEIWNPLEGGVWSVDIVDHMGQENWLVARFTSRAEWEAYKAQHTPPQ